MDSRAPSIPLEKYVYNETRYTMLTHSAPEAAAKLLQEAQEDVRKRWKLYEHWAAMPANGPQAPEPAPEKAAASEVAPEDVRSRPFQALWRGINYPGVTWKREMPASLGDLASVMASTLTEQTGAMRALGESSYLLVADEYMNLNSRLAYHFTLVDACISATPGDNYISFRFAGGGAAAYRRDLRARFIEGCLTHYGFPVDRRGDLVNAWYKKAPPANTEANLDLLGRLMASTSQLDMYMTSQAVMLWYVQQFLEGNYSFSTRKDVATP